MKFSREDLAVLQTILHEKQLSLRQEVETYVKELRSRGVLPEQIRVCDISSRAFLKSRLQECLAYHCSIQELVEIHQGGDFSSVNIDLCGIITTGKEVLNQILRKLHYREWSGVVMLTVLGGREGKGKPKTDKERLAFLNKEVYNPRGQRNRFKPTSFYRYCSKDEDGKQSPMILIVMKFSKGSITCVPSTKKDPKTMAAKKKSVAKKTVIRKNADAERLTAIAKKAWRTRRANAKK